MELALLRYENSIQPGDISFLYFSGYGFQQHGNNYLVGTDLSTPDKPNAVALNLLIESINEKSPQASVLVVDACYPFSTLNKDGLAELEASHNTYIAFACKPGQTILDNRSVKSESFSTALLNNISRPVDIDTIFRDIQNEVRLKTHGAQESWWSNGFNGSLMLASAESIHSAETSPSTIAKSFSNDAIYSSPEILPCKTSGLTSISLAASSQKQAECIAAKMLRLRDDLAEFQARTAELTTNMTRESLAVSGSLATLTVLFYSIWTNPVVALALTALLVLLIAGGFIHRDFWPNATREYALAVHAKHRQFVSGMLGDLAAKLPEFPNAPPPNMIRKPSFLPFEQDSQGTLGDFNSLHAYWSVQPVQEKQ